MNVLVSTLDGRYIGETIYTYNASLMTQFEQCVKALDDDHMEVDIHSSKEGDASLNYRRKPSYTCISLIILILLLLLLLLIIIIIIIIIIYCFYCAHSKK